MRHRAKELRFAAEHAVSTSNENEYLTQAWVGDVTWTVSMRNWFDTWTPERRRSSNVLNDFPTMNAAATDFKKENAENLLRLRVS